jgi:RNA polymerase sigma-70 factor (ECF subfamily)
MDEDHELVRAAQGGERDALDRLLRRHYERVYAVCRRITGNDADAADASQEAMVAAVRGLERFDHRAAFSTWIYRIATNASLDELRRRRRRPVPDDHESSVEHLDPSSTSRFDALGDRLQLDAAIAALPPDFRAAVVLRDVADLDYEEIATVLDVPIGTVKSRIARARAALASSLGRWDGNPPATSERPTGAP